MHHVINVVGVGIKQMMDVSNSHGVYNNRHNRRSCSFIISSLIAVIIHLINLVVTSLFLGVFVFVYTKTDSFKDGDCFLFSNISESTRLCGSSIAGIGLLWLLEIALIVLGVASVVMGRRMACPKSLEVIIVVFCLGLGILVSMIVSVGMNYQDKYICQDNHNCGKYEYYIYIFSWLMVVLFFSAFIVHFIDCIFHLPSRRNIRNNRLTYSTDHWFDERVLLRSTEAKRYNY